MNFKPLGERVLVERTEVENKTASGIIIPDNANFSTPANSLFLALSLNIISFAIIFSFLFYINLNLSNL